MAASKSSTTEDLSSTTENGEDIVDTLPNEVWEAVFDKVNDSQDWLNLCRTTTRFHNLMERQRVVVLFPEVFSEIDKYLSRNDVLNCRLICRKWKNVVESQTEEQLRRPEVINQDNRSFQKYPFPSSTSIQRFIREMGDHKGNPLFGSCLRFYTTMNDHGVREEYWKNAIQLLSTFGTYVRFLSLTACFDASGDEAEEDERIRMTLRLVDCLRLVPNLEILHVILFFGTENCGMIYEAIRQLPRLEKLERLSVETLEGNIWVLCCSPEKLKQVSFIWLPKDLPVKFPNIEVVRASGDELCILKNSSWPLKSLSIISPSTSLSEVFTVIESFSKTLTKLELLFELDTSENGHNVLKLPNLQYLKLGCLNRSLKFLDVPKLEKLIVEIFLEPYCDVYESEEKTYNSDIWWIFPKLKVFRFRTVPSQFRVYRREKYDYRKNLGI